jgi:formylglycine-generating enzyme
MTVDERQIMHAPNGDNDPQGGGKNYLLVIGIDHYPHHTRLSNAVADAKGFADVMTSRYGFTHLVEPLYDAAATQTKIRQAIGKCESLGENDRLIVFYAGHGWYKTKAKLGYIVPTEAKDDPNSDFVPVNFITDIFRSVDAKHILLIVDCCFGGSFGVERNALNIEMTEKVVVDLDAKYSRMVLSSGGIEPVSDGLVSANNSPFTAPLLDILRSNKQPLTVFSDVFPLLRKKTKWNTNQMPQYKVLQHLGHADGELALYCTDLESPEEKAYKSAIALGDIKIYAKFITDFPKSIYKAEIKDLLKEKRVLVEWEKIKDTTHIEKLDDFIDDHEDHPLADLARQRMADLSNIVETSKPPKIITPPTPSVIMPKKYDFEPEMVFVKGGTFKMGGNNNEREKPIHEVSLSDFHIGKFPVIQAQWQAVMGNNPSHFKGDNLPVEQVSWEDIQIFLEKINAKTNKKYCLPTEAEWEFAARGGIESQGFEYSGSNDLKEVGWFSENSGSKTHAVGQLKPNELGIYDMSGNVWEWCSDWYDENYYKNSPSSNPKGAASGSNRVFRGGGWVRNPGLCRSANRSINAPANRRNSLGFRLALSSLQ